MNNSFKLILSFASINLYLSNIDSYAQKSEDIRSTAVRSCKKVSDCFNSCKLGAVNFRWYVSEWGKNEDCSAGCATSSSLICKNLRCQILYRGKLVDYCDYDKMRENRKKIKSNTNLKKNKQTLLRTNRTRLSLTQIWIHTV